MKNYCLFVLVFFLFAAITASPVLCAEKKQAQSKSKTQKNIKILHGNSWVFGQSADRKSAIWQKGVNGASISKKTLEKKKIKKATDTRPAISQALSTAEEGAAKNSINMHMQKSGSGWAASPDQQNHKPDEEKMREQKHILGAYAGVNNGKNLQFGIGPELILKDDEHSVSSANAKDPDSVLGMGMKFKYDF